jgi:uncharacterized protein (DUF2062 family)
MRGVGGQSVAGAVETGTADALLPALGFDFLLRVVAAVVALPG